MGEVNVTEELKWRLDALYRPDHWYVKIPFPDVEREIQMVVVSDTSGSLCDDVLALGNITNIIKGLRLKGKKVSMTLYLLEGQLSCCSGRVNCAMFEKSSYFHFLILPIKVLAMAQNKTLPPLLYF